MELTGLIWWMKPVSSHLVAQKKMKVGGPLVPRHSSSAAAVNPWTDRCGISSGPCGPPKSPHPAPPLPDRRPFCSSAPPVRPIGQSPHPQHARGSTACRDPAGRFRASSTALSELDPQIRKPSHKKKTGDILTSASDKPDDDSTQPNNLPSKPTIEQPPSACLDRSAPSEPPAPEFASQPNKNPGRASGGLLHHLPLGRGYPDFGVHPPYPRQQRRRQPPTPGPLSLYTTSETPSSPLTPPQTPPKCSENHSPPSSRAPPPVASPPPSQNPRPSSAPHDALPQRRPRTSPPSSGPNAPRPSKKYPPRGAGQPFGRRGSACADRSTPQGPAGPPRNRRAWAQDSKSCRGSTGGRRWGCIWR